MKKTVFLATAAVLSGMIAASSVFADDSSTTPAHKTTYDNAVSASTPAWVTFTPQSTNPDTPVVPDPSNPDHPNKPGDGGNPNDGPLALKWAPQLDFGTHELSTTSQHYGAIDPEKNVDTFVPYAQVSDERGTGAGWALPVKEDGQFKNNDKKVSLNGAVLEFTQVNAAGNDFKPTQDVQTLGTNTDLLNNDVTVMQAKVNTLNGNYFAEFGKTVGDEGVKLTVPGNAALAGEYSTTLNWTLNAAPDAPQTPAK